MKLYKTLFCLILVSVLSAGTADEARAITFVESNTTFHQIPAIEMNAYDYLDQYPALKSPKATRFIIVRHGQSTSNKEKTIAGRTLDADLSEEGVVQAVRVGKRLAKAHVAVDAVYSSPMVRAKKTALLIQLALGLDMPIVTDERLHERYFGPYEGVDLAHYMPVIEGESKMASGCEASFEEKIQYKFHDEMESYAEAQSRFMECLNSLRAGREGKTVLVASHGAIMKCTLIADTYAKGYELDYHSFILDNSAVLVIEIDDEGAQVMASNDLSFRK